jgi:guanine deaminase
MNTSLLKAIEKARESVSEGGFPAGAIIVKDETIIGEGISIGNKLNDPTSHGEIDAIRDACRTLKTSDLKGAILYGSMEPCSMCLSAAAWAGISKLVFACSKERVTDAYYCGHYDTSIFNNTFSHPCEIEHVKELEEEALSVVKEWEKQF